MADVSWHSSDLQFVHTSDGYAVFLGPHKVGTIGTKHFQGLVRNGQLIMEELPRSTWCVHWCEPITSIDVMRRIVEAIPQEA